MWSMAKDSAYDCREIQTTSHLIEYRLADIRYNVTNFIRPDHNAKGLVQENMIFDLDMTRTNFVYKINVKNCLNILC